ncbi:MAG: D-alanyl-D-alanine carboxypeptidase [Clostridia bacterium]|nr:D-alanyl-D-alanine carboxypeptidase [Clostridia bacterium]
MFGFPISSAPVISAKSAILINADTGEAVAEYNADEKLGMASTTKIMTAVIAIESGKLDEKCIIPKEAIGVEGSSLYLQSGESMTLRELVTGLMLRSANDAAEAIAVIVGGSVDNFVAMMNEKATELGLYNTHFCNPHGLSSDEHYTTARELALITAYALKNETFCEICSTQSATLPGVEAPRYVANHNKMLKLYDDVYGVKTGFTKATGRCLVTAAKRDGVNLIAVTLNAPDDWNDHRSLLDYGFAELECVSLAKAGDQVAALPILGGDKDSVTVYVKEDISACLNKSRGSIVERIELNRPKFAPVYAGEEVGRIVYLLDGKEIASSPLCTAKFVGARSQNKTFLEKIFN